MIDIKDFISNIPSFLQTGKHHLPWQITASIKEIIEGIIPNLGADFNIENGIAIHKSVVLEQGITFKGPLIKMDNCHIGANGVLSPGTILEKRAIVKRLELIEQVKE